MTLAVPIRTAAAAIEIYPGGVASAQSCFTSTRVMHIILLHVMLSPGRAGGHLPQSHIWAASHLGRATLIHTTLTLVGAVAFGAIQNAGVSLIHARDGSAAGGLTMTILEMQIVAVVNYTTLPFRYVERIYCSELLLGLISQESISK
jgi:hypothetical protein